MEEDEATLKADRAATAEDAANMKSLSQGSGRGSSTDGSSVKKEQLSAEEVKAMQIAKFQDNLAEYLQSTKSMGTDLKIIQAAA